MSGERSSNIVFGASIGALTWSFVPNHEPDSNAWTPCGAVWLPDIEVDWNVGRESRCTGPEESVGLLATGSVTPEEVVLLALTRGEAERMTSCLPIGCWSASKGRTGGSVLWLCPLCARGCMSSGISRSGDRLQKSCNARANRSWARLQTVLASSRDCTSLSISSIMGIRAGVKTSSEKLTFVSTFLCHSPTIGSILRLSWKQSPS
jgi:hypothetical protein